MDKFKILCVLILSINSYVFAYNVLGFCGNPGKPFNSKLEPDKQYYYEGEEVVYSCDEYWGYVQPRKCVNGKWIGDVARCVKTISNNEVNYAKLEDISSEIPQTVFEYNITLSPSRVDFPNSFLSKRFPFPLETRGTNRFRWTIKLQNAVPIPQFRINFNYINVSLEESKQIGLSVEASVSAFRICELKNQGIPRIWWNNGVKIDHSFVCDANSEDDYISDAKNPNDYIILETKASADITYRLIAVYVGKSYGSIKNQFCGEPETRFGVFRRIVDKNRDYSFDCVSSMDYIAQENPDLPDGVDAEKSRSINIIGTSIHKQRCGFDMRWKGTYPACVPRVFCSAPPDSHADQQVSDSNTRVVELSDIYYLNETSWFAVNGSKLRYECNNPENEILLGDATHRCVNGNWIGRAPRCYDIKQLFNRKIKNRAANDNEIEI